MKRLFLFLLLAVTAFAQNAGNGPVTKKTNTNAINEDLTFGTGRTLSLTSGSTLNLASGVTYTGTPPWAPTSRTISTTAPLTGGGALSGNLTFAIPAATSSTNGYLTSADWQTFNGKQAANVSEPRQMLLCSGTQGRTTATLANAIGTGAFDMTFTFTVPSVDVSGGAYGIFNLSTNGSFAVSRSLSAYIEVSGKLLLQLYGVNPAADARDAGVTGFRASYAGQTVKLRIKRTASGLVLNLNGQNLPFTDVTHGTAPAWTDTINGVYFDLATAGAGSGTSQFLGAFAIDYLALGNLSDSEYANYFTTGQPPSWFFTSTPVGTQLVTAGNVWSGSPNSQTYNSFTFNSPPGDGYVIGSQTFNVEAGKKYAVSLVNGGANGPWKTFLNGAGNNEANAVVLWNGTGIITAASTGTVTLAFRMGSCEGLLSSISLIPIGALAYFPDSGASPSAWYGNNGAVLTIPAGVTLSIQQPDMTPAKKISVNAGVLATGAGAVTVSSTLPASNSVETGVYLSQTGSGSGTGTQTGFRSDLLSGYAGNAGSFAGEFVNYSSGTGSNIFSSVGNFALRGVAHPNDQSTNSTECGIMGQARWGSINFGLFGLGTYSNGAGTIRNGTTQYGVGGIAQGDATAMIVGGYFGLYNAAFYPVRAALNAVTTGTDPIFVGRTDNVTKASIDYQGNQVLVGTSTVGGQLLAADGSTVAPGIAFSGAPNMGFVRQAAGIFDAVANNSAVARITGVTSANRYVQITNASGGGTPFIAADGNASTTLAFKTNNAANVATTAVFIDGQQNTAFSGSVALGGTSPIKGVRVGSKLSFDVPSIAAHDIQETTLTVTGAKVTDRVIVSRPSGLDPKVRIEASCLTADTITIAWFDISAGAIDPPAYDYYITSIEF